MLVPALAPLCLAATSARPTAGSGPLMLALAAVGAHSAAMLGVSAAVAIGAHAATTALRGWVHIFSTAGVAFHLRIPLSLMKTP